MSYFPPTIILRHRKENKKKCSLRGLEKRSDMIFLTYPQDRIDNLSQYVVLKLGAPPISLQDQDKGIVLIDGTWRYSEKMLLSLPTSGVIFRSIPNHPITAYPRKQTACSNPEEGLASCEALYIAYHILKRETKGLLDHYHWKDQFLKQNGLG